MSFETDKRQLLFGLIKNRAFTKQKEESIRCGIFILKFIDGDVSDSTIKQISLITSIHFAALARRYYPINGNESKIKALYQQIELESSRLDNDKTLSNRNTILFTLKVLLQPNSISDSAYVSYFGFTREELMEDVNKERYAEARNLLPYYPISELATQQEFEIYRSNGKEKEYCITYNPFTQTFLYRQINGTDVHSVKRIDLIDYIECEDYKKLFSIIKENCA